MQKVFVFITCCCLLACTSSPKVDVLAGHDFSQYQRFALLDEGEQTLSLDQQRLRRAVLHELEARGLQQSELEQAQLLVKSELLQEHYMQPRGGGTFYEYDPFYDDYELVYEEPSSYEQRNYLRMRVILSDKTLQQQVWQASNELGLGENIETAKRESYFQDQVSKLFAEFPLPLLRVNSSNE